jgi:hypothetical protein
MDAVITWADCAAAGDNWRRRCARQAQPKPEVEARFSRLAPKAFFSPSSHRDKTYRHTN